MLLYQTVLREALRMEVSSLGWLVLVYSVMMMQLAVFRRRDARLLLLWWSKASLHQLSTVVLLLSYVCAMVAAQALVRNLLNCSILTSKFGLWATRAISLVRIAVLNQWSLFIWSTVVKEIYSLITIMNLSLVNIFCWSCRSSMLGSFLIYDSRDSCPILNTLDSMLSSRVATTFAVSSFIISLRCLTLSSALYACVI